MPSNSTADGKSVELRLVTLSPHLAELVVTAGALDKLVGVSAYSDFPEDVRALPRVGDAFLVDLEALALLEPDVVLAWESGTPASTVENLRQQGHRVEVLRTQRLADVATALETIGRLTGTEASADAAARRFVADIDRLGQAFDHRADVRVFYQISTRPVYTVNEAHFVSELITLCGGENIFSDLDELAPLVSEESVLARDPEAIIAGGVPGDTAGDDPFSEWRRWETLAANRYGNFFTIDADLLARATTRLVHAGRSICEALDAARVRRDGQVR